MHRRAVLMALAASTLRAPVALAQGQVLPGTALHFPRDHGAHPDHRTEWWYITGEVHAPDRPLPYGFQITFFRSRNDRAGDNPSAFTPRQLLFAHAAVTDLTGRRLLHDQRIARQGFGLAEASEADTDLRLRDWTLARQGSPGRSRYTAHLPSREFTLELSFAQTQPVLLQGEDGYSRKGPEPAQASHYYTQPQLATTGRLRLHGQDLSVTGRAWLDHEWSEALMHPEAVGWDWIGMNLDDGTALTAFRLRRRDGSALWAGGSWRPPGQPMRSFGADEVVFHPRRHWTSPATAARYPVEWAVETPAGRFQVNTLLDAQELDSRGSTGAIYWEGLSELRDARGRRLGRGYLEMTGYASALRL
jgi:predicted secreted hydrolase